MEDIGHFLLRLAAVSIQGTHALAAWNGAVVNLLEHYSTLLDTRCWQNQTCLAKTLACTCLLVKANHLNLTTIHYHVWEAFRDLTTLIPFTQPRHSIRWRPLSSFPYLMAHHQDLWSYCCILLQVWKLCWTQKVLTCCNLLRQNSKPSSSIVLPAKSDLWYRQEANGTFDAGNEAASHSLQFAELCSCFLHGVTSCWTFRTRRHGGKRLGALVPNSQHFSKDTIWLIVQLKCYMRWHAYALDCAAIKFQYFQRKQIILSLVSQMAMFIVCAQRDVCSKI